MLNHNDYNPGDKIRVVNDASMYFKIEGVVTERKRYIISVNICNKNVPFQAFELEKIK